MNTIETIKEQFQNLPGNEQELLLEQLLQNFELRGQILENVVQTLEDDNVRKPCPYCSNDKVYKRGKQDGVQMYQCCSCKKWYSTTTGTPLWDIKLKDKWQGYLRCMEQKMTIKKTAKELNISIQTSFDWRHKILSALSKFEPQTLSGTVECDEMELALSNKGEKKLSRTPRKRGNDFKRNPDSDEITTVQIVTAVERAGETYMRAVETKRLSAEDIQAALSDKLADETTLITDNHASYKAFAKKEKSITHKSFQAREHVSKADKTVHLQHVNNTHSQIRDFLKPFKGVSSKYLQNYLCWFAYSPKLRMTKATIKQWLFEILDTPVAYDLFWAFKKNAVNIRT